MIYILLFLLSCSPEGSLTVEEKRAAAMKYVDLGTKYLERGQVIEAKTKLLRAQELAELPETNIALGQYWEYVSELEMAKRHYLRAIDMRRDNGLTHRVYADFLCKHEGFMPAIEEYNKSLKDYKDPLTALTLSSMGACASRHMKNNAAINYLEKSLRYNSNNIDVVLRLLELNFTLKKYDRCHKIIKDFYSRIPVTVNNVRMIAVTAKKVKDHNLFTEYDGIMQKVYKNSTTYNTYKKEVS